MNMLLPKHDQPEQIPVKDSELYRLIAENVSDAIWTMSLDMRYTYVSPSMKHICGFEPDYFIGHTPEKVLTPESLVRVVPKLIEEITAELQGEGRDPFRSQTLEVQQYVKDGSPKWVETTASFLRNEEGKPIGLLGVTRDISERKAMESALRESEEKYRVLIENIHDAVYIYTGNRCLFANRRACEVIGYTHEELLQMHVWDIVHPDDRERLMLYSKKRFSGVPTTDFYEARVITRSGEIRYIDFSVRLITYEGKPAALGTVHDITDLKQTQNNLRELAQNYRQLLDSLPEIVIIHIKGTIVYANNAAAAVTGYTVKEIVGTEMFKFVVAHDWPVIDQSFKDRLKGIRVGDYEITLLTKSGESRSVIVRGEMIRFESEEAVMVILIDITERKQAVAQQAEIERLKAESRFREALESSRHILFRFNVTADRFEYIAPVVEDILGYPKAEIRNWSLQDSHNIIHPDDVTAVVGQISGMLAMHAPLHRGHIEFECRRITNQGNYLWFYHWFTVYYDATGKPENIAGSIVDITERKLAEENTRRALRREKELGELKSRIVSMISHEFRTPLTAAGFALDLLHDRQNEMLNPAGEKYVRIIRQSMGQMTAMLDDVLLLSRIEAGRLEVRPQMIQIDAVLEELVEQAQALVSTHRLELSIHPDARIQVRCDRNLLSHALLNLISNAVKYSPSRNHVFISVTRCSGALSIAVRDWGIGIPKAEITHLGESFYRATNVGAIRGTGIGLTIVQEMAKRIAGTVHCVSTEGEGSLFTLEIPCNKDLEG